MTLLCSDVFGNVGGDWVGCIASQGSAYGNLCADPMFCGPEQNPSLPYSLHSDSPCAPGEECGLIGAYVVGCGELGSVWGQSEGARVLRAISPNPCGGHAVIQFLTSGRCRGDVRVLDVTGRLVRDLSGGREFGAGWQELAWDARDAEGTRVESGVYWIQIRAGDVRLRRAVSIVR